MKITNKIYSGDVIYAIGSGGKAYYLMAYHCHDGKYRGFINLNTGDLYGYYKSDDFAGILYEFIEGVLNVEIIKIIPQGNFKFCIDEEHYDEVENGSVIIARSIFNDEELKCICFINDNDISLYNLESGSSYIIKLKDEKIDSYMELLIFFFAGKHYEIVDVIPSYRVNISF